MSEYLCKVCEYTYDEQKKEQAWDDLPGDWLCPVCESGKSHYELVEEAGGATSDSVDDLLRDSDEFEHHMADVHQMAETGESVIEPMRTRRPTISWDDILIKGAQLARLPLNPEESVNTTTVIGPRAKRPLVMESPIYVMHMSFGALSREAKIALARGSAAAKTAMCSGEGGILPESLDAAYRYIFEYVPNEYSATAENLRRVDAIEIKIGQSVKPGMGGHLPGRKVTAEIAEIRGFPEGSDIISPSHFADIRDRHDLKRAVDLLRDASDGRPIGIKLAAGNIEDDLAVALYAGPDFITIDGRPGATGAAPKLVKLATSVPTVFALHRARKYFDENGVTDVSLLITGGLRVSPDFAKALAMGADGVAIGTAALMACGCQQYRVCDTGKCPMGITTHDPALRARFDVDRSAKRLENFLRVSTEELATFARLTGHGDVHALSVGDLCSVNSEISNYTSVPHA